MEFNENLWNPIRILGIFEEILRFRNFRNFVVWIDSFPPRFSTVSNRFRQFSTIIDYFRSLSIKKSCQLLSIVCRPTSTIFDILPTCFDPTLTNFDRKKIVRCVQNIAGVWNFKGHKNDQNMVKRGKLLHNCFRSKDHGFSTKFVFDGPKVFLFSYFS